MPIIFRDSEKHVAGFINDSLSVLSIFDNLTHAVTTTRMPAAPLALAARLHDAAKFPSIPRTIDSPSSGGGGGGEDVATFLIASLASCFIVLGGIFPYVPQYLKIKRENSAEGFSLYVCLALLSANILRIFFWFGQPFETPLLLQSIVMITTMLIVLHAATHAEKRRILLLSSGAGVLSSGRTNFVTYALPPAVSARRTFSLMHIRRDFWQWTDFESYLQFLVLASAIFAVAYYFLVGNYWVVQTVGTVALVVEACQPVPQFWKNFKQRSTDGMSITMVCLWALGDFFKTIYFVLRNTPLQFPVCGLFQLAVDCAILAQVYCCFFIAPRRVVAPASSSSAYARSNSAAVRNVGMASQMSSPSAPIGVGWSTGTKPVVD